MLDNPVVALGEKVVAIAQPAAVRAPQEPNIAASHSVKRPPGETTTA